MMDKKIFSGPDCLQYFLDRLAASAMPYELDELGNGYSCSLMSSAR
jgi:hypothetical protein